jgi:hypothetical protein
MNDENTAIDERETIEQAIARAEAESAKLKAQRDALLAAIRPAALARVLGEIRAHGITRAELDPALRKRPKVARGQRKPKAVAGAAPSLVVQAAQSAAKEAA